MAMGTMVVEIMAMGTMAVEIITTITIRPRDLDVTTAKVLGIWQ